MIENTMVSGYGKPDREKPWPIERETVYRCEVCKHELRRDETVYLWDDEWVCDDCMNDAVMSLSPEDRADIVGEEICYTEQMVEMARTYEDLAELMCLEKAEAWSVL